MGGKLSIVTETLVRSALFFCRSYAVPPIVMMPFSDPLCQSVLKPLAGVPVPMAGLPAPVSDQKSTRSTPLRLSLTWAATCTNPPSAAPFEGAAIRPLGGVMSWLRPMLPCVSCTKPTLVDISARTEARWPGTPVMSHTAAHPLFGSPQATG